MLFLHSSLLDIRSMFHLDHLEVKINCSPRIVVDSYPNVLSKVLACLLMNTSVHGYNTINPGKVLIAVTQEDESLLIEYKDWGIGLTEEAKKKLFEPFYTTIRGEGGSGLGGHIIYNLITQTLKGDLSIEGSSSQGFHLQMRLPLAKTMLAETKMKRLN